MSQSATRPSAEETAVRDLYRQFMDAWNRGSGAALAAVFTDDGGLVGFDGTTSRDARRSVPSTSGCSTSG